MNLQSFKNKAEKSKKENKVFLTSLKKKNERKLDDAFHQTHEEVFEKTNCLECANCCKTTSPIVKESDINRISKEIRLKPKEVIDQFLIKEPDGTYIMKTAPCPFLDGENYCSIYQSRPTACREFPHTNRKKMSQLLTLTYNNTLVCPAVFEIVEKLKSRITF